MKEIVICLNPYQIISPPPVGPDVENYSFKKDGKTISGTTLLDWCSLPDILVEKNSRKFIGLSFRLVDEYKNTIENLVTNIASDYCKYFDVVNSIDNTRYQGLGDCDYLELYWDLPKEEVCWEFASLIEGCWLYDESEVDENPILIPYGYWLSLVDSIKDTYDLE